MSILVVGEAEKNLIAAAIEAARKNAAPWSVISAIAHGGDSHLLLLGDRKVGVDEIRAKYKPQNVMLGTYRVAFSFEHQPAGLMRHISVSTRKGKVPSFEVMDVVLSAFGFSGLPLKRAGRIWNEEFEPGWFAVNVVEMEE